MTVACIVREIAAAWDFLEQASEFLTIIQHCFKESMRLTTQMSDQRIV